MQNETTQGEKGAGLKTNCANPRNIRVVRTIKDNCYYVKAIIKEIEADR